MVEDSASDVSYPDVSPAIAESNITEFCVVFVRVVWGEADALSSVHSFSS